MVFLTQNHVKIDLSWKEELGVLEVKAVLLAVVSVSPTREHN